MRVLQLIDSLEPGGAERVAVTIANALSGNIEFSALITTRAEGGLKDDLNPEVQYLYLRKKKRLDWAALMRLKQFVKKHEIGIIHAHTTSYFFAVLLKFVYSKVRIIWHEHNGKRIHSTKNEHKALVFCSKYFHSIITVNEDLKGWCEQNLKTKNVTYLQNFIDVSKFETKNVVRSKTIVCLANLREPKNHLNLLYAFNNVRQFAPDWTLSLIGRDFNDSYSGDLKKYIQAQKLDIVVSIHGTSNEIPNMLASAAIGVLSSDSEGLPMALLEYGAAGLAVISTDVGMCREVISTFGAIVPAKNWQTLAKAILSYIDDNQKREDDSSRFQKHIEDSYSVNAILPSLKEIYTN